MSKFYYEFDAGKGTPVIKGTLAASNTYTADKLVARMVWAHCNTYGYNHELSSYFTEFYDPDLHDYYLYESDERYDTSS